MSRLLYAVRWLLGLALLAAFVREGHAQWLDDESPRASSYPWMWEWGALRPIADLGRRLPSPPPLPSTLDAPQPRLGLALTAGNPASLADDIVDDRMDLGFGIGRVSGDYRRPLEPDERRTDGYALEGFRRLGARSGVIGRVALDRITLRGRTFAVAPEPHSSSPFIMTDTSAPRVNRPTVTLEGAQGIALGNWRLGVALGYQALELRSHRSSRVRAVRTASSGASAGIVRRLRAFGGIDAGVQVRRLARADAIGVLAFPFTVRLYELEGYGEVPPRDVADPPVYRRRIARDAWAYGASLGGEIAGARWVTVAERESMREYQSSAQEDNPPTDKWLAAGTSFGAGAQRRFGRVMATARARWSTHRGTARRMDLDGVIFRAEDSRFSSVADLRSLPHGSPWDGAATLSFSRDGRTARDALSGLRSAVRAWSPGAGLEITRTLTPRLAVGAGYAVTAYSPAAQIPATSAFGPVGRSLVAPELEMTATRALAQRMALTMRWNHRSGRAVILRVEHGALEATGKRSDVAGAGDGKRSLWVGSLRVVGGP